MESVIWLSGLDAEDGVGQNSTVLDFVHLSYHVHCYVHFLFTHKISHTKCQVP